MSKKKTENRAESSARGESAAHDAGAPVPGEDRRGFVTKFLAALFGGICGLVPFASGLAVILDPLRRKASGGAAIRSASLDSVPDDGVARQFPVIADRTDAWNTYPQDVIGSVFLRRERGSSVVECLHATCPHAGCYVDFDANAKIFQCPCHDSKFTPDGKRIDPHRCPSPRDLDSLKVAEDKLADGEVWIEFMDFQPATPEKKAR